MITRIFKIPLWLLTGLINIFTSKKLFLLNAIPYLIGIISFITFSSISFTYKDELVSLFLSTQNKWFFISISWLSFLILTFISAALSIISYLLFGSIFIEFSTEELLKRKGFRIPEHSGFKEISFVFLKSLKDDGIRIIYITFLSLLTFACSFIPFLIIFPFLLTSFIVGLDIINLPLSLIQIPIRERIKIAQKHSLETCLLGALFTLSAFIPFLGIVLYPGFINIAVELISSWKLEETKIRT